MMTYRPFLISFKKSIVFHTAAALVSKLFKSMVDGYLPLLRHKAVRKIDLSKHDLCETCERKKRKRKKPLFKAQHRTPCRLSRQQFLLLEEI